MLSLAERHRAGLSGSATGIGAGFCLVLKAMKISEESPELSLVSALLILGERLRTLGGNRGGTLGLGLGQTCNSERLTVLVGP